MFEINKDDMSIYVTRGDIGVIELSGKLGEVEEYEFKTGDIVRLRVMEKGKCDSIVLSKDITITESTTIASIPLYSEDTRIGEVIHKPVNYWYEIELNPDTKPQTMVGYDRNGPKIFRLFPEGVD